MCIYLYQGCKDFCKQLITPRPHYYCTSFSLNTAIPGTIVGFSSATYTGTETSGNVAVCVEVFNPTSGGATQPFDVTLLPAGGDYASSMYTRIMVVLCFQELSTHSIKWNVTPSLNLNEEPL